MSSGPERAGRAGDRWDRQAAGAVAELVERERELALLEELVAAAESGRGAVVVVEGEPGVGKSALAAAAGRIAAGRGCAVLGAVGSELEAGLAYGVVRQLFGGVARGRDLAGPAVHARPVLAPDPLAAGGAAGADPFPVLNGLYWLQLELADEAPVLVVVDDAQWADPASVRWLHFVAERVAELRSLVLATVRPRPPGPIAAESVYALSVAPALEWVALAPLSEAGSAEVARRLLGGVDDELGRACHRVSGGNPFYLHSLVAALERGGDLAAVESFAPEGVTRSVLLRLGRLGAEAVAVIRAAAVLGGDADLRAVSAMTGMPAAAAAVAADALVSAGLLEPGWPLRFVHPIVRSAVYADLLPGERGLAHARAARVLADCGVADERIALQLLSAEPVGDGWVVERLRAAAQTAGARGAGESAIALLERALGEPPPPEALGAVLGELGVAERHAMRPTAAAHIEQALARVSPGVPRAQLAVELATAYIQAGRMADAVALLEQARAESGDDAPALAAMIDAQILTGCVQSLVPIPAGVRERAMRTLAAVRVHPVADRSLAAALAGVEVLTDGGAADVAVLVEQALKAPREPEIYAQPPFSGAIFAAVTAERFGGLDDLFGEAIAAARAAGSLWMLGLASSLHARYLLAAGRLDTAELEARVGADAFHGPNVGYLISSAELADVLLERGQPEAARDVLADAERVCLGLPDALQHLLFHGASARVALSLGDAQLAAAHARTVEGLLAQGRLDAPAAFPWRRDLALALHRLGDRASAKQLAGDHATQLRAFGAPGALADGLHVLGLITGGHDGLELLREAVETAEAAPARPLVAARARLVLGGALRRQGQDRAARELLQVALDGAEQLRADALAHAAREELIAAGARPRAGREERRHQLTPSEQRVARLAADGATNREIAQALFVTPKTVETHLRGAFRKLDIGSRQQLAAALGLSETGAAS